MHIPTLQIPLPMGRVWRKLLSLTLASLFLAGGLWILSLGWLYHSVAASLPEEIRAARQEGLSLTPADLMRATPVPDSQNAAPLYSQITTVSVSIEEKEALRAVLKGQGTDADRRETRRLLAKYDSQLHLVEKASTLPDCDFHRNWSLGPELLFPEYAPLRNMVHLLAAQAMLQCDAGDPESALHAIEVGAHVAHHIGKEPKIIAMLFQLDMERVMNRAFQQIVTRYADRPDILRLAEQTEQVIGVTPNLGHALSGEVVNCRIIADMIREGEDGFSFDFLLPKKGALRTTVINAYEARSLSFWRSVYSALKRTQGDPMATYRAAVAVSQAEEARETGAEGKTNPTYELSSFLCPQYTYSAKLLVIAEAQGRLRRTLLALHAYRQQKGHFPETLSLLSATSENDPFLNQPFHYRRTERGFLLYSVGTNLTDDGGNATPAKEGDPPPDIVISFP